MTLAEQAQINIRVDNDTKIGAEMVFNDIGLSMSSAINIFLKTVKREHRIPFELSSDPFYSEANIKYLEERMADVKSGKAHFEKHDLVEVE